MNLLKLIFGDINEKEVKKLAKKAEEVEALEPKYQAMKDDELRAQTPILKARLEAGEGLDDILCDAFAVAREAAVRVLGKRPFFCQIIGGIAVHQGRIAEMKTGEGKTLVATMPAYLNALSGKGVHVITVNDYLAKRDRDWMGKVYEFLGLNVGVIVNGLDASERRAAYSADITYGTNAQFGFDYLRDNMAVRTEELVQRGLNFAIVDEVDSILIDEARTPLIISGATNKTTDLYVQADQFAKTLHAETDVKMDEKARTVTLTDGVKIDKYGVVEEGSEEKNGVKKAESYFGVENLSDASNMEISHHINQAIMARFMMKKDVDYIVKDGEVLIVDQFTGRLMYGRRYSNGLHQAIEAKENIKIQAEDMTLATITIQNYFRMYRKLSGMTGTAKTEEEEFKAIYGMDVVVIPTNKPVARTDYNDQIYSNLELKFKYIIREIKACYEKGQPVLVGTVNIETSEFIGKLLKRDGIPHEILNAKHHEREAEIIAQAGRYGAVTIATNMAGRGTDIILGGNAEFMAKKEMLKRGYHEDVINYASSPLEYDDAEILEARGVYNELYAKFQSETDAEAEKVRAAGGLHIIGTERHESRRIDNQLRGRSGRQGDPGSSRFFISLKDDLMRIFIPEKVVQMTERLGEDAMPIEMGMITKNVEMVQHRVEGRNFAMRKNVLEFDDVINKQREIIYDQRRKVLYGEDVRENIMTMIQKIVDRNVAIYTAGYKYPEEWELDEMIHQLLQVFGGEYAPELGKIEDLTADELRKRLFAAAREVYASKEASVPEEVMRELERNALLRCVDNLWIDHITAMDELRRGISLRAIGQEDPVMAYKREGFDMFDAMISEIQERTVSLLMSINVERDDVKRESVIKVSHESGPVMQAKHSADKVGRNDPCPCGSGKKYKKCCGKDAV